MDVFAVERNDATALHAFARGIISLSDSRNDHQARRRWVSILAYGIVIWAMQFGAMGVVSALRETSVVFATMIGQIFSMNGCHGIG